MKKQVLVIGKDQTICDRLQMALCDEDIIVNFADSSAAIEELAEEAHYCLLIWDTQREILFRSYSTKRLGKPVDIEVCAEQIRSMIQQEQNPRNSYALLSFAPELIIDQRYHSVTIDRAEISLTPIEFDLLLYMAKNPGQVFSIEQLYMHIWLDVPDLGTEKTVRVHLSNLRKKFSAAGKEYIQNVRGVGYRFIPPTNEKSKNV